jgi:HrpA-like RNA helicase
MAPDGGGEVADTARRSEHLAAWHRLPILSHGKQIAGTVRKNRGVILAELTRSGKSTQVLQFLLEDKKEEEEEEEEDPINGSGDDPHHPPNGILEQ